MKLSLGHLIYGLAAILFGLIGLVWHDFNNWQQIRILGQIPHREILASIIAIIEIIGGLLILSKKTARYGAIILGTTYLIFAVLWVPFILKSPLVYDNWGNFFEQFSLVSGAMIIYSIADPGNSGNKMKIARPGYFIFGICVVSFTLEQLFYLSGTASFVPKWIPPGQMFWAITTTIALALAAIALLTGYSALLAARLLIVMIICFGLLIWLPSVFSDPHKMFNWAGNAENLGIAGAAWIVADYLSQLKTSSPG